MSVAEQFSGLNMDKLIGGPLTAASDASINLARSTADFINQVGFDADGKVRTAVFGYQKRSPNEDGTSNLEEMKVAIPILAIVPIPNLQIDEVNILFDMEVKQSEKSEESLDLGASISGSAKFGPVKVNITGNVSSHSSNTRSSDNSAKYHVDIRATNHGAPEGLSRVLDMMAASISPVLVNSSLKDGNGQDLSEASRVKAENMKRLRGEIAVLENQVSAAQESLDTNIGRFLNVAEQQRNAYQSQFTALSSKLSDSDEDKAKEETYTESIAEVNDSWLQLRNQAKDYMKLVASEDGSDEVSSIFGLKAFDKDGGVKEYASGESQYAALLALQKSSVDAQKKYDALVDNLLEKKTEYNNAVVGTPAIGKADTAKEESANDSSAPANPKPRGNRNNSANS